MVEAVIANKKRKRSHADKRTNKKKQEVEKGESKPVAEEEKPTTEGNLATSARKKKGKTSLYNRSKLCHE